MAKALTLGVEDSVSLATTVTKLTGVRGSAYLTLWESDVDVYVVTGSIADGASLPSTGRPKILAVDMPLTLDISEYGGDLGLAGTSSGTCRITVGT